MKVELTWTERQERFGFTPYMAEVDRSLTRRVRGLTTGWFPLTTGALVCDWFEDGVPAKEAAVRFVKLYRSGERPISRTFQTV